MNKHAENQSPTSGCGSLSVTHGSLLSWEPREDDPETLRGYLTHQPHNTLFFIETAPGEDDVLLSGAFVPDEDEQDSWDNLGQAKAAAEQYMRGWLLDVAGPLLANKKGETTSASSLKSDEQQ